ncbi:carbohydrate porin [Alteromonas sp. ASW11-36]|uniref:Carbohydrate porin n=1 Tax=Alteromonas arenosi TaxID=3055817 RepID=A0ABT7SST2_9ALTE|nr:carbohydrate porin [Alteromonas sp. ASW11-36]MDM7859246.1 carbohydrate porin [Alteromonas sp. ASW11-36]
MRSLLVASSVLLCVGAQATQVELAYTGDYFHNTQGGIRTGDTYLDLFEININHSFELNDDWILNADMSGFYTNGKGLSEAIVGDIQVVSNLEGGGHFTKLATATLELAGIQGSLKLGLYDINSEFDVLDSAGLFINSAHGIGSELALTGENGPSIYPFYSFAVRGQWAWNENHLVRVAVMDGVPGAETSNNAPNIEINSGSGYFSIFEYEFSQRDSKLLLGAWQYSKSQPLTLANTAETEPDSGNLGLYLRYESSIFTPQTHAFYRLGFADSNFNLFDRFFAAGVTHQGLLPARPDDTIGIAIAYLRNGETVAAAMDPDVSKSHETNIELTYQYMLDGNIVLQPNVQYIVNPSATYRDAMVVGLRLSLAYELL